METYVLNKDTFSIRHPIECFGPMNYFAEIGADISGLDKWQQITLVSMCVESVFPIVKRFALAATLQTFEDGLEAAWKSAQYRLVESKVRNIRGTIDDLAESRCDDSNAQAYEVMVALGILTNALEAVANDDPTPRTQDACSLAVTCYSGYDQVLTYGNEPQVVDPLNPPRPGHLTTLQIQSQRRLIDLAMKNEAIEGKLIREAQTLASRLSEELSTILPRVVEERGWAH
jgi:hypothetical protein